MVNRKNIKSSIVYGLSFSKEESERLVRYCEKKVRMLMLPSVDELKKGKVNFRNLPEVHIEDLLGREEICINMTGNRHFLERQSCFGNRSRRFYWQRTLSSIMYIQSETINIIRQCRNSHA